MRIYYTENLVEYSLTKRMNEIEQGRRSIRARGAQAPQYFRWGARPFNGLPQYLAVGPPILDYLSYNFFAVGASPQTPLVKLMNECLVSIFLIAGFPKFFNIICSLFPCRANPEFIRNLLNFQFTIS